MSFRAKLAMFFVLVVVVPMLATAFVLLRLVGDNEAGKADARLASRQTVAVNLTRQLREDADVVALRIAGDARLRAALAARDRSRLASRLTALRADAKVARVRLVRRGRTIADSGTTRAVFPTLRTLVAPSGAPYGTLAVAVSDAPDFARSVESVTGLDAIVAIAGRLAGATLAVPGGTLLPGRRATVEIGGAKLRAASFDSAGFGGKDVRVTVLEPAAVVGDAQTRSRMLVIGLLLGFMSLALTLGVVVSRSLSGQLQRFLEAARRIGAGDFSARVTAQGADDLAQLGDEFNKMAGQLAERVDELRVERERLRGALRRTGTAVASNLDRDGLLDVVVAAAVDGVGADAGRASVVDEPGAEPRVAASSGADDWLDAAMSRAEAQAIQTGEPSEVAAGAGAALARPLQGREGRTIAVVTIARSRAAFTDEERDILAYLSAQGAASIENVMLHERAEHQAATDALTGLANRRQFEERLLAEVDRTRRFPAPLGLMMLDVDHFKNVNDRHGHQAGDDVLRAVAGTLAACARDVDVAARYGGEEMAVLLPGADVAGAMAAAERLRKAVEVLDTGILDAAGEPVRVTVSVGVAALGEGPTDGDDLVAQADAALYRAKRAGRNRTEAAAPSAVA